VTAGQAVRMRGFNRIVNVPADIRIGLTHYGLGAGVI
jgi:hypothetical protein